MLFTTTRHAHDIVSRNAESREFFLGERVRLLDRVDHFRLSRSAAARADGQFRIDLLLRLPDLPIEEGARYLVNPGSVGQPRDNDPRAGFALADTERREVTLHRIAYPVEEAQARIAAEGLPQILAQRLALGR